MPLPVWGARWSTEGLWWPWWAGDCGALMLWDRECGCCSREALFPIALEGLPAHADVGGGRRAAVIVVVS